MQGILITVWIVNREIVDNSLLLVVILGVVVNGWSALYTFHRKIKFNPCNARYENRRDQLKSDIGCLTIKRALRVEIGFFLVQLGRLIHSIYALHYGYAGESERFWAAFEREFATLMMMYLTLADLLSARRIARLQDELHPIPPAPPL